MNCRSRSGGWHSRLSTERDSTRIDLGATYTPGKPLHCLFLSSATILPSAELSPCALHAGKSGNQIERCIISTFQIAESMGGFKGDFRQWDGCEPLWTLSQEIGVAGDLVSYQAKSRKSLFPTFISFGGSFGERARLRGSPASKSSGVSFRAFRLPKAWALKGNFANGRIFCGLANNGALQIVQWQPGRPRYWRNNLKGSGFDPITEIIRNLFRFHLGDEQHRNAEDFPKILQALNYQNDIFLEHGAVRWKGASSAHAAGLSANENHSKPRP
jgi:hypothetical protein